MISSTQMVAALRDTNSKLVIVSDVVVGGEEIDGGQLTGRQTHHLGITGPAGAIPPGVAQGSDDGNSARTLYHYWTSVDSSKVHPPALIRLKHITTPKDTTDCDFNRSRGDADIAEAQLTIQGGVVIRGEKVSVRKLAGRQPHKLEVTGPLGAIEPGIAQRDDDRDSARTLHLHRTAIHPGIADTDALTGVETVGASHDPADGDGDGRGDSPDISEA